MSRTLSRHKRLLLAPLTSLSIALGLAVIPATSAMAAPADTSVSIQLRRTPSSAPATGGRLGGVFFDSIGPAIPEDTFVVTGRLTEDTAGTGLAGKTVTLVRARKTDSAGRVVATATTDANGGYRFPQHVVGSAAYAVAYQPTAEDSTAYNGSESTNGNTINPVVVFAMRDFNAGKRKVKGKLYFKGDINPGWGNHPVRLQRKTCASCGWRTIATRNATRTGAWSFQVAYPPKVGPVWRYQAVIAAANPPDNFERSFSAQLTTRRVYTRTATAARVG